jgi:hypothetical protein
VRAALQLTAFLTMLWALAASEASSVPPAGSDRL